MAKYYVKVTEKLSRYVEVDASDASEAEEMVEDMHSRGDIILDADDYQDYAEFEAIAAKEYEELFGDLFGKLLGE